MTVRFSKRHLKSQFHTQTVRPLSLTGSHFTDGETETQKSWVTQERICGSLWLQSYRLEPALTAIPKLLASAKVACMEHQALCIPLVDKTVPRGSDVENKSWADTWLCQGRTVGLQLPCLLVLHRFLCALDGLPMENNCQCYGSYPAAEMWVAGGPEPWSPWENLLCPPWLRNESIQCASEAQAAPMSSWPKFLHRPMKYTTLTWFFNERQHSSEVC